jgi:hypothetical protein
LLLGLLILCLAPRAIMAWKIGGICPDAALYIRQAESLEQGDLHGALDAMRLNLFPVILMLLHRAGLPWEAAGAWWGVVISSCTVLPLFGWVRRQFDDRVALAACFLYAVHPALIRWSPEVIRDPTFWFLFTLSLYLLWRAVTELRWPPAVAAGAAMALASMTRIEGALLLAPLALWSLGRGWARPEFRGRLVVSGILCVGVYPLLLGLIAAAWFDNQAPWQLVRTDPLETAREWAQGDRALPAGPAVESPARAATREPPPLPRMIELFATAGFKGITPVFLVGSLLGMTGAWRLWRRFDHQVLVVASLPLCLAIWIHLWRAGETSLRYFFPVAILMTPLTAMGLIGLSQGLARMAQRSRRVGQGRANAGGAVRLASALPALAVLAVGLIVSLGTDCRSRTASAELGRWAREELGPSPLTFGPDGVTQVVNYYAQGRCQSFPRLETDSDVAARVEQLRPDLVLLPADRKCPGDGPPLVERIERLGFVQVDRSGFTGGCRQVLVLRRGDGPRQIAPTAPPGAGRRGAGQARMPGFHAWIATSGYC